MQLKSQNVTGARGKVNQIKKMEMTETFWPHLAAQSRRQHINAVSVTLFIR